MTGLAWVGVGVIVFVGVAAAGVYMVSAYHDRRGWDEFPDDGPQDVTEPEPVVEPAPEPDPLTDTAGFPAALLPPTGAEPPVAGDELDDERTLAVLAYGGAAEVAAALAAEHDLPDVDAAARTALVDMPRWTGASDPRTMRYTPVPAAGNLEAVHGAGDPFTGGHLPNGFDPPRRVSDPDDDEDDTYGYDTPGDLFDRSFRYRPGVAVGVAAVPVDPAASEAAPAVAAAADEGTLFTPEGALVPGPDTCAAGPGTPDGLVAGLDGPRSAAGLGVVSGHEPSPGRPDATNPGLPQRVRGMALDEIKAAYPFPDQPATPRRSGQVSTAMIAPIIVARLVDHAIQEVPAVLAEPTPGSGEIPEPAPWTGPDMSEHTGLTGAIARLVFHDDGTVTTVDGEPIEVLPQVDDRHRADQDDDEPAEDVPDGVDEEPDLVPAALNRADRRAAARRAAAAKRAEAQRALSHQNAKRGAR